MTHFAVTVDWYVIKRGVSLKAELTRILGIVDLQRPLASLTAKHLTPR